MKYEDLTFLYFALTTCNVLEGQGINIRFSIRFSIRYSLRFVLSNTIEYLAYYSTFNV